MKKQKNYKHLQASIQKINTLERKQSGRIIKTNTALLDSSVEFKPEKNKFKFSFNYQLSQTKDATKMTLGRQKDITIKTKKDVLVLKNVFVNAWGFQRMECTINSLNTFGFSRSNNYYYRFILPISKELDFHYYIKHTSFSSDLGYVSALCSEVNFEGKKIEIYSARTEGDKKYAVIETNTKMSYKAFSQIVFAMLVSYGYVTGYMPGDKGYYIAYGNKKMSEPRHIKFKTLRDTTKSFYSPIYSNAFGRIPERRKEAEKINALLRPMTIEEFSKLFEITHNVLEFSSILLLILESSTASLLFMPGGYAIALESLSDLIMKGKKTNIAPIKDKELSKKIIKECQKIIAENCTGILDKDALGLLNSRIESNINKPTNKALLKAPFDLLGIKLSKQDLQLLETRNDFLHGRIPDVTKAGKDRPLERQNADLYYCASRFYTLLNVLILKWIGYDNYVVNHVKLGERSTGVMLPEEKAFRKV